MHVGKPPEGEKFEYPVKKVCFQAAAERVRRWVRRYLKLMRVILDSILVHFVVVAGCTGHWTNLCGKAL